MPVLVEEPNLRIELTPRGIFHVQVSEGSAAEAVGGDARPDVGAIMDEIQVHLIANAPVLYLVDLSAIGDLALSERWDLAGRMKQNRQYIARSALYGLSSQLEFAFRVIIRVSGRKDLRVFPGRAEAEAWLLEDVTRARPPLLS
jgi:hypothetical protein